MDIELVTIATAAEQFEGEFLRNQLEAKGFEVFLADDNIVGTFNLLAPAVGWIKIQVKAEDAKRRRFGLKNCEIRKSFMTKISPKLRMKNKVYE